MSITFKKLKKKQVNGLYGYYAITLWNTDEQKLMKLPKEQTVHIKTRAEAELLERKMSQVVENSVVRSKKRLEIIKKNYDVYQIFLDAEPYFMKRYPNSYKSYHRNLRNFVLYYYLHILKAPAKDIGDFKSWHFYFQDFKQWLEYEAMCIGNQSSRKNQVISYSTKNHCIAALNLFIDYLYENKFIIEKHKCEQFSTQYKNKKDITSYMSDEELDDMVKWIREHYGDMSADFFYIMANSGLRISEALGLSLKDYIHGQDVKEPMLKKTLDRHDVEYYGYINLSNQLLISTTVQTEKNINKVKNWRKICIEKYLNARIKRKPLKSKNKSGSFRVIPILDKKAADLLDKYADRAAMMYSYDDQKSIPEDYLLFPGLSKSGMGRVILKAAKATGQTGRSSHDCRHTYATNIVGKTLGDIFLASIILGHSPKSPDTTMKYLHIWEKIQRHELSELTVFNRIEKFNRS